MPTALSWASSSKTDMFGRRVAARGAATAAVAATGNDVISADAAVEAATPAPAPPPEAGWCSGLDKLLLLLLLLLLLAEAIAIAGAVELGGAGAPNAGKPRPKEGNPRPRGGKVPPKGFSPNGCMVSSR